MPEDSFIIIAVDGGAATGKSSTSRGLAARYDLLHVDTGTHYRALTLACLRGGVAPVDSPDLHALLGRLILGCELEGREAGITLNGARPDADALRGDDVNALVSHYAALPEVRNAVKAYQRGLAQVARRAGFSGLIMDGRDIGTVIFPDADLKIFLEADEATRSRRRAAEGQVDAIAARDRVDAARKTAPLKPADDAHRIDSGTLDLDEVVARIAALVERHFGR